MATPAGYLSEVNENKDKYPDFDFRLLNEPPPQWEFYKFSDKTVDRGRELTLKKLKELVDYHTWGIEVPLPPNGRRSKKFCLKVLRTISYNQQRDLRPDWESFSAMKSDAGPLLLWPKYNAWQISRFHPHGIPGRPLKPLLDGGDTHSTAQVLAPPPSPANIQPQAVQEQFTGGHLMQSAIGSSMPTPYNDTHSTLHSTMLPQSSYTDAYCEHEDSTKVVEGALIQFTYRDLERHPLAFPSPKTYSNFLPGAAADLAHLVRFGASGVPLVPVLSEHGPTMNFRFNSSGIWHPYRGRGPIWGTNSCAIDSIIVAGKFLDAGSTVADRGNDVNWSLSLSPVEYAYMEATSVNWDTLPVPVSTNCRDMFLAMVLEHFRENQFSEPVMQHQNGFPISIRAVWEACTKSFHQFRVKYTDTTFPCHCRGHETPTTRTYFTPSISPTFQDGDDQGVDMGILMARHFQHGYHADCVDCGTAGTIRIQRNFGDLPWRLVVQPDQRAILKKHTVDDIVINYVNLEGAQQTARYRWLGGIYSASDGATNHYRVLWDDHHRGQESDGSIRMYDSKQCSGAIIGSIRPPTAEERVPGAWLIGKPPPLLFYEKVVSPRPYSLVAAQAAVTNMMDPSVNRETVLRERGWAMSRIGEGGKPLQPKYILNRTSQRGQSTGRFQPSSGYLPASQNLAVLPAQQSTPVGRQTPRQVGRGLSPAHNKFQSPARNVMPVSSPITQSSSQSTPRRDQKSVLTPATTASINSMTGGTPIFQKQPVKMLQHSPTQPSMQSSPNQYINITPQGGQKQQTTLQPQSLTLGKRPSTSNLNTQSLPLAGGQQYSSKGTTRKDGMQQHQSAEMTAGLEFDNMLSDINNQVNPQPEQPPHYASKQADPSVDEFDFNALDEFVAQLRQDPDAFLADRGEAYELTLKELSAIPTDFPDPLAGLSLVGEAQSAPTGNVEPQEQDTNAMPQVSLPWQEKFDSLIGGSATTEQMPQQNQDGAASTTSVAAGQSQLPDETNAGQVSASQDQQAATDAPSKQGNEESSSNPKNLVYDDWAESIFDFKSATCSPEEFITQFEENLPPAITCMPQLEQAEQIEQQQPEPEPVQEEVVREQQPGVPIGYYTEGPLPVDTSAKATKRKRAGKQVDGDGDTEGVRKKPRN